MNGWWLPAAPFVAALLGLLVGRLGRRAAAALAVGGAAVALLVSVALVATSPWTDPQADSLALVPTGWVDIDVLAVVDGLSATIAVMVCVVALLVQIYSVAYMEGDPRYPSYAMFVSLFTAAMLLVVVAGDLVVLLVGWEVMGICSYFLVGHHWELEGSRPAAVKAFLTTRIGDVGFVFGIFVLATAAGSSRIDVVLAEVSQMSEGTLTAAALLLTCGVVGKSAQFPLHVWLPDAMAGPTPISALIHAATMVAAGIFLVVRLYPVFLGSSIALGVLGVVASITMLGAALAALAQDDLKRVLAYSTVSQLAYMLGALAVGGRDEAVFHLLTHAAFKALLFLAAGCVIHAVRTNLMQGMGGLRRAMPVTFWSMTIGFAALVGIPPLSGFFSKESVLHAAEETAFGKGETLVATWVGWLVLVSALLTVLVTAAYATRAWLRTFFGESRAYDGAHLHEAPRLMVVPVALLAIPAAALGVIGLEANWLSIWSSAGDAATGEALTPAPLTTVLSLMLVGVGVLGVWWLWREDTALDPARHLGRARPALVHAFYVDDVYAATVVRPVRALARGTVLVDDRVVDEAVEGTGRATWSSAALLRRPTGGNVQGYLTGALGGAAVVALVVGAVTLL